MADWSVGPIVGAMADWVVGPIMDKIINTCSDYLQDQYRWQTGMKEELERLRENHPKIQAVVSAYTRAQIRDRNPDLNRWIWQLRDAIDEADDLLEDFEYMKLEEEQQELNMKETKVRSSFTRFFSEPARKLRRVCERALKKDPNLERLEAVVKKLDKVSAEVSTFLDLIENAKKEQQELDLQLWKDRKTGCLPKNDLIGRGEEKEFVMQWLRKPTNEDPTHVASSTLYKNISLLSIVGHGGMGKTTLLQHIYEDPEEEFELKMWVWVSKDFDPIKVIADMLEFLNKTRPRVKSLATVQELLKTIVKSKKFLLVLDDIWEEDRSKWEDVFCPLTKGSFGSKILITTRMDAVASVISKVIEKQMELLRIKGLEEDACLKLLNTHAFANVENHAARENLTDIAKFIVKRLSGSPMAAKVIGIFFNSNSDMRSSILVSPDVLIVKPERILNKILPNLRLSFKFLPQDLQNCFAFCGIFPQDHKFDKDDLVQMWIALGFIQEASDEGKTLEDIGGKYFDVLVRNFFFDKFQYDEIIYYKMHDLFHDLAQSVLSEECFRFMGDNVSSLGSSQHIRHLFVKTENLEALRKIEDVKKLRSLFLTSKCYTEILLEIFKASTSIRLLFIDSPYQEKISEAITNLRHLRYLNFTGISSVYGIGKLRSLQELNEFNVKNENGYKIGELEHMNELRKLKIHLLENVRDDRDARNAKLFEKRKLTDLFLNWGNTVDEWNLGSRRNFVDSDLDVNVLENLKPYKNLKRLSIFSYNGVSSAEWMYNADLISNLEYISLNGCSEWETLPPFGQLPHLKSLYLCNMPKAKRLDYKFHGNDKVSVFPSLEVLNIKGLQVLKDWFDAAGAAEDDCFFPCLTELFLDNCPYLQELPYVPPKLKKMKIQNIAWKAALICKQETNNCCLETLEILSCPNITSLLSLGGLQQVESGTEQSLQSLPSSLERLSSLKILRVVKVPKLQQLLYIPASLEELHLEYLESLRSLPSSWCSISSLRVLYLYSIPLLESLPELPPSLNSLSLCTLDKLQRLPSSLSAIPSLNHLSLVKIPCLKSLPDLPSSLDSLSLCSLDKLQCLPSSMSAISSLNRLSLYNIPLLKSLPELPPTLSSLHIISLEYLESLQCLPSSLSAISSLNHLYLHSIPFLKSLPDLPFSLNSITVENCHPELMKRYKKLSGSDWHKIAHIPNVRIGFI